MSLPPLVTRDTRNTFAIRNRGPYGGKRTGNYLPLGPAPTEDGRRPAFYVLVSHDASVDSVDAGNFLGVGFIVRVYQLDDSTDLRRFHLKKNETASPPLYGSGSVDPRYLQTLIAEGAVSNLFPDRARADSWRWEGQVFEVKSTRRSPCGREVFSGMGELTAMLFAAPTVYAVVDALSRMTTEQLIQVEINIDNSAVVTELHNPGDSYQGACPWLTPLHTRAKAFVRELNALRMVSARVEQLLRESEYVSHVNDLARRARARGPPITFDAYPALLAGLDLSWQMSWMTDLKTPRGRKGDILKRFWRQHDDGSRWR